MMMRRKLFTLLAILCLIASSGMACAADLTSYSSVALGDGVQYAMDSLDQGSDLPPENQTSDGPTNASGNTSVQIVGDIVVNAIDNATGNSDSNDTSNASDNSTHNSSNATAPAHPLLSTGNPIIVLMVLIAAVGGCAVLERKR